MDVGTILVADVKTQAGNYANFFIVSKIERKTFYAKRLGITSRKIDKITNMLSPDITKQHGEFKISQDAGGYFVGDNKDKKTIKKMYVVEATKPEYKIVFDPKLC